jgi:hypothetical protein
MGSQNHPRRAIVAIEEWMGAEGLNAELEFKTS